MSEPDLARRALAALVRCARAELFGAVSALALAGEEGLQAARASGLRLDTVVEAARVPATLFGALGAGQHVPAGGVRGEAVAELVRAAVGVGTDIALGAGVRRLAVGAHGLAGEAGLRRVRVARREARAEAGAAGGASASTGAERVADVLRGVVFDARSADAVRAEAAGR